ncbi:reverse transcriptase domain-containing protein [Tanacetum coccineum]
MVEQSESRTRSLVEHLSTDLPSTYKGLMEKTYTWVEARESVKKSEGNSCYEEGCKKLRATSEDVRKTTFAPRERNKKERTKSSDTTQGESKRIKAPHPRKHPYLWSDSSHNVLLGRIVMQRMGMVVSTIYGAIKFHTKKGIKTILLVGKTDEEMKRAREIPATNEERVLCCVNVEEKIILNTDVFAWTHVDMIGIPRTIMVEEKPFNTEHKLNEYSHVKPIKQNKRGLGPDHNMAACKETEEHMKEGILRKIDWKIESLSGLLSIQMAEEDKDKTAFYAGEGVFCYKKIPFGLKNAGARYQRLVDKVFSHQIRRNLEAYVDDMVIKSTSEKEMLKDIQETFERSLAFFKALKGCEDKKSIQWTYEADKALEKMKKLIQALPTLTALRLGETLTMHLATSKESISVVLAAKRNKRWTPIYFPANFRVEIPFEDNEKEENQRRCQIYTVSGDSTLMEPPTQTDQEHG